MPTIQKYTAETDLPVSIEESFAFHERPGALQRLIPPWESATVEKSDNSIKTGSQVILVTRLMGVKLRWVAEHTVYEPPRLFADTQLSGPFAKWNHRHEFERLQAAEDQSLLRDRIEYQLPLGPLGSLFGSGMARKTIEQMFSFRHRITRDDLSLKSKYPIENLRVAVSGASGLVGSNLSAMLGLLGHDVSKIVRSPDERDDHIAAWSGAADQLAAMDAVVHLAGKSIASGRWNEEVKQEIRDSRVMKTRQLCESLASLPTKPKVLICASATGIYGDRGDEVLSEDSQPGDDFLADVAQQWEAACQPAVDAGIRVVHARFGIILSPKGGALEKSLLPAKLAGGALGSGNQWWSWIALDDVLGAIYHCIAQDQITGPVNFVSPNPVRNREFAKTLGRVIGRPAIFPAPVFALRAALGEMADALLLSSCNVMPNALKDSGYEFRFPELQECLRYCLGKNCLPSITDDAGK